MCTTNNTKIFHDVHAIKLITPNCVVSSQCQQDESVIYAATTQFVFVRARVCVCTTYAKATSTMARPCGTAVENVLHGKVDVNALRLACDLDPITEGGDGTVRPA